MHTLRCVSNACTFIHCSLFSIFRPGSKAQDLHLPWYSTRATFFRSLLSSSIFAQNDSFVYEALLDFSPNLHALHTLTRIHSFLDSKRMSMRLVLFSVYVCVCVPPLYYCTTTASIRSPSKWTQYIIIYFNHVLGLGAYVCAMCVCMFLCLCEIMKSTHKSQCKQHSNIHKSG